MSGSREWALGICHKFEQATHTPAKEQMVVLILGVICIACLLCACVLLRLAPFAVRILGVIRVAPFVAVASCIRRSFWPQRV